jgi:hypothetical protein
MHLSNYSQIELTINQFNSIGINALFEIHYQIYETNILNALNFNYKLQKMNTTSNIIKLTFNRLISKKGYSYWINCLNFLEN